MKILEIISSLSSGGAERLAVDLSNALAEQGHDVTIVTTRDINDGENGFYKSDISDKVKIKSLDCPDFSPVKNGHRVAQIIKREKPDVAHFHMVDLLAIESMLRFSGKIKFFSTIHNDIGVFFNANSLISRQGVRRTMARTFGRAHKMRYIAISQVNYDAMKKAYPYCETRLIYNGRSLPKKSPKYEEACREVADLRVDKDSHLFIHVARCTQQKNQGRLIRNFNRLVTEGNVNAELIVLGNNFNETDLGKGLQNQACERIHFLGTRTNIWDYLLQSDAFILSSDFEGMPISLLEALSCGLPCISTPVCGVIDLISDGVNGVISRSFSDEDYYEALLRYIKNNEDIQRTAKNEAGNGKYDISQTAKQYVEFFEN